MRGVGSGVRKAPRGAHPRVTMSPRHAPERVTRVRSPARSLRPRAPSWAEVTRVLLACAACFAAPAPTAAQDSSSPSLEVAEAAADSGDVERARELLDAWIATREGDAPSDRWERARFLEARLAEDPDSARRLYARLAVESGSEIGARARLRLAQLRLARGEAEAALGDLELVRADFPGSPAAAESWLWTGRARQAAGAPGAACRAYDRAGRAAAGAELADLRRRAEEARSACRERGGEPASAAGAAEGDSAPEDASAAGRWVVQLGAFRDPSAAEELRERAEEAGFRARVVTTADDRRLHRVRVGRFGGRTAAEAVARRLEDRGFRALIVESAGTEDGS